MSSNHRAGEYVSLREFGEEGELVRDIHFTDHGNPRAHTNPHQHIYTRNPDNLGGSAKRGGAEVFDLHELSPEVTKLVGREVKKIANKPPTSKAELDAANLAPLKHADAASAMFEKAELDAANHAPLTHAGNASAMFERVELIGLKQVARAAKQVENANTNVMTHADGVRTMFEKAELDAAQGANAATARSATISTTPAAAEPSTVNASGSAQAQQLGTGAKIASGVGAVAGVVSAGLAIKHAVDEPTGSNIARAGTSTVSATAATVNCVKAVSKGVASKTAGKLIVGAGFVTAGLDVYDNINDPEMSATQATVASIIDVASPALCLLGPIGIGAGLTLGLVNSFWIKPAMRDSNKK